MAAADLRPLLILYGIQKKGSFGDLLRTAAAFDVCEVVVVGMKKIRTLGAHGSAKSLVFTWAADLETACTYVREQHGATVCGIEIVESARSVGEQPFAGRQAFMLGNEGQGMPEHQLKVCDHFVYIPQYSAATASLNINCSAAIVLESYARWAKLTEAPRAGFKFVTHDYPPSSVPHSRFGLSQMVELRNGERLAANRIRRESGGSNDSGKEDALAYGEVASRDAAAEPPMPNASLPV